MTSVRILTEKELRAAVALDLDAVDIVEKAFRALSDGGVVMPPVLRLDIADSNGEVDVKTAYVPGFDSFAIKISPGFFDNPKLGLPSLNGMMVVFSAKTGLVEATLLDNGYLTDVRTAAAGAVAARALSREDARTVGVLGAGMQARLQVEALSLVRDVERVRVWARNRDRADAYARDMADRLGKPVEVADAPEAVVRASDIVITTTPSRTPLIEAAWVQPGQHITAMGSDAEEKNELSPAVLARADRLVCDRKAQCAILGELHHAVAAGALAEDAPVAELGDVLTGKASGRDNAEAVTVADLTGTGVQDTAIARHAVARSIEKGFGTSIDN